MSLFTYIKYPVDPDNWTTEWYRILPSDIADYWASHKDIRHIVDEVDKLSNEHRSLAILEIRHHNLLLLKKIILEWEDD